MKKVLVIIKREYMIRVKTRAFLLGTLISPLLLLALIIVPGFLATRGGGDRRILVLDQSGDPGIFEGFRKKLDTATIEQQGQSPERTRNTHFVVERIEVTPDLQVGRDLPESLTQEALKDSNTSLVLLPRGILDDAEPEYFAKNLSDFSIGNVERAISAAVIERRFVRAGLDPEKVNAYVKPVNLRERKVTPEGITEESGAPGFIVGFVMLFFIYMSILFYGLFVMRGVIEEKQSRIVEVIASSVRPTQMMMGKLLGIGLVGLTQFGIWVLTGGLLSTFGLSAMSASGISVPKLPPILFVYFLLYFILGYFLYATLYAMVGAMVSSEEDAQQAQVPVTILIVVPMMLFGLVMNNPSGNMAVALSMVPFFAPTLMMLRIAIVNPPVWQILASMALMVITILGAVWLAAKIYRVGILMYGKRPSIAELGRWLRYT